MSAATDDVKVVPFDAQSVVEIGRNPGEFRACAPNIDILLRDTHTVQMPSKSISRLCISLAKDSYETLRWFMAPVRECYSNGEFYKNVHISVSAEVPETESGIGSKISRLIKGEAREIFRICTSIKKRRNYTVIRVPSDVFHVIQALQMAFPELLFPAPATINEVDDVVTECLCSCIVHAFETIKGFLPVLYFLFESNESALQSMMAAITTSLHVEKMLRKPEKKSRSWFWNSSNKISNDEDDKPTTADDFKYVANNANAFGSSSVFKPICHWQDAAVDLHVCVSRLVQALEEEDAASRDVMNCYSQLSYLFIAPPEGMMSNDEQKKEGGVEDEEEYKCENELQNDDGSSLPLSQSLPALPQSATFLDMLRTPSKHILVITDANTLLVRRLAEFSRLVPQLPKPKAKRVENFLEYIDSELVRQSVFANSQRRQALLQICVIINCITRHLGENATD